jgi:hypothetical protein
VKDDLTLFVSAFFRSVASFGFTAGALGMVWEAINSKSPDVDQRDP